MIRKIFFVYVLTFFFSTSITAQNLEKEALTKIKTLENLIKEADKKGIDVLKKKQPLELQRYF